jgi:hypothetical protein
VSVTVRSLIVVQILSKFGVNILRGTIMFMYLDARLCSSVYRGFQHMVVINVASPEHKANDTIYAQRVQQDLVLTS